MQKKYKIIALSLLSLCQGSLLAQDAINDNSIVLYSLGYELGKDIKGQQLEYQQEILLQGIRDAMAGTEPMVDARTQRQALASIKQQRAEENLRKGEAFLAENAKKEGVTTLPSGLQYRVITAGNGPIPGPKDSATVEFRGSLIDGTEFASSKTRGKPATLKVNRIIKGLSEALQLMPTGSKWEIYIPAKLGYGKRSPGDRVPANSTLIYEIKLLSVKPAPEANTDDKQASPTAEAK
jgi:FKBP-type peptidyl-prolyl cis-trans isomerase FklB